MTFSYAKLRTLRHALASAVRFKKRVMERAVIAEARFDLALPRLMLCQLLERDEIQGQSGGLFAGRRATAKRPDRQEDEQGFHLRVPSAVAGMMR
jgi:hypothetical protein